MMDNTDSDLLSLLPKSGTVRRPAGAEKKAAAADDDDDDIGLVSPGGKSAPAPRPRTVPSASAEVPKRTPPVLKVPSGPGAGNGHREMPAFSLHVPSAKNAPEAAPEKKVATAAPTATAEPAVLTASASKANPADPQPGEMIDCYQVVERLEDQGGLLCCRVFHPVLKVNRMMLLPDSETARRDPGGTESFFQRAAKLAGITNPHLHNVLRVIHDPDGCQYVLLEEIHSERFCDRDDFGHLSFHLATMVINAVSEVLAELEKNHLSHGQLRPRCLCLSVNGSVLKVGNLLRLHRFGDDNSDNFFGEVYTEGGFSGIQRDLFCAGVLFYEMLTGKTPQFGTKHETVNSDPRSLVPTIPGPIAVLVLRLLATERMTRFANASELLQAAHALENSTQDFGDTASIPAFQAVQDKIALLKRDFSIWVVIDILLAILVTTAVVSCFGRWETKPIKTPPLYPQERQKFLSVYQKQLQEKQRLLNLQELRDRSLNGEKRGGSHE